VVYIIEFCFACADAHNSYIEWRRQLRGTGAGAPRLPTSYFRVIMHF